MSELYWLFLLLSAANAILKTETGTSRAIYCVNNQGKKEVASREPQARVAAAPAGGALRDARSLTDLAQEMSERALPPLKYMFYGCYCGPDGRGTPTDASDRCCCQHDRCYGNDMAQGCHPKVDSYKWAFVNGVVTCGHNGVCEQAACECDAAFVKCLTEARDSFSLDNLWLRVRRGCQAPVELNC